MGVYMSIYALCTYVGLYFIYIYVFICVCGRVCKKGQTNNFS